jgi:tetratricopeptide (TPR) repeat protein
VDARAALAEVEQELSESEAVAAYRHLGSVAELYGDLEAALDLYSSAGDLGHEASRLSAAGVLFELGRLEEAEDRARRLVFGARDYAIRRRATGVVARCMAGTGRTEEAVSLLSTVAAIDDEQHLEPELLFLLIRLAERSGQAVVASTAREKLSKHFPDSLESSLIGGSAEVVLLPSLPNLLNVAAPPEETAESRTGEQMEAPVGSRTEQGTDRSEIVTSSESEEAIGVQTGSFRDPENAGYMARDLRALGFTVVTLSSEAGEPPLHRVVVKRGSDQSVQELLMELKSRGIEGFLLF